MMRFIVRMFPLAIMASGAGVVSGQNFPNKPIRIVTGSVGSSSDFVARLVKQGISGPLGQPVIVDNRASGVIPGQIVSQASPDGYTLLVIGNTFWTASLLRKVPYDPVKDFSPVSLTYRAPLILVVHPSLSVKSVKELIALAKAKPGALNNSSTSIGGSAHLAGELFKSMAGVDIVNISYKTGSTAMADLVGGQVQMSIAAAASVMPHVKSGRLKALAVTSLQPSALFPGLPAVAESLPGYEAATLHAVFVPAKTPATIINRLNREIVRFVHTAEAKERSFNVGVEPVGGSPEELAATIRSEMARMGKVIRDAGIRAD